MVSVAAVVMLALALPGHSRSEGTSRFVADAVTDRVAITINLVTLDLPELCEVDLSLSDPDKRHLEEQRLQACVEGGLPEWLRLRTDAGACQVVARGVERGPGLEVTFTGTAACPPLRGATVTIDWGLFASTRLDHISTATIVVGDDEVPQRTLFSRRNNKVRVKIPKPVPWPPLVGAATAIVASGIAVALRRRRQLQQQQRLQQPR